MAVNQHKDWEPVQAGGENLSWAIVEGMVQVRLPFRVNLEKLSQVLQKQNYHTSDDADETDALGWGREYDAEGYYPHWVFPNDDRPEGTILSFPPEDYDQPGDNGEYRPFLGKLAQEELGQWLGLLRGARE
ncbi:MAG: hypothetical protein ACM3ZA_14710 [Bacillota bacterium]